MRAVDQGESLSYESRHWTKVILRSLVLLV
jgi:hypothetical protein